MAREMKDSGIEWIGRIPAAWSISRLKYIGQYINGYAFKPEQWGDKGKLIIRIQDLTGSNDNPNYYDGEIDDKYCINNGDILVSWAATLDAFIWNKGEGLLNQHIFKAVHNPIYVSYEYFYWLIKVAMEYMNNDNKHGIVMQHVTLDVFGNFAVSLPPIEEQNKIAKYLNQECARIDAVMEQTRASIEEYKKLKQTVITQAVTKGIRPNRSMKDSGVDWIGEVNANYSVRKLKSFSTTISKGTTPKTIGQEFDKENTIRFIKSENIIDNQLCENPLFTINNSTHTGELKRSQLNENDILFVIAGASIGKTAIIRTELLPANTNQATSFIRIEKKYRNYIKYIWYVLQSDLMKIYISLFAVQSAQPNLSMEDLANFYIPLPDNKEEIKSIIEYIETQCIAIDELIIQKATILTELGNFKRSLIYEFVTGKKEIRNELKR